jgi:restriction system protein
MGRSSSLLVSTMRTINKAGKDYERQRAASERSAAKNARIQSREDRLAWIDEMQNEAEWQTEELKDVYKDIDSILTHTLEVDDFFDLESLRKNVSHPTFQSDHEQEGIPPVLSPKPTEPVLSTPVYVKILTPILGANYRKSADEKRTQKFAVLRTAWVTSVLKLEEKNEVRLADFHRSEMDRNSSLVADKTKYDTDCLEREMSTQKENAELDQVIAGLPLGKKKALETYLEIVLAKSEYPENMHPEVSATFDEITRELSLDVDLVNPTLFPDVDSYRFQKSTGEILEKKQTIRETKLRFENFCMSTVLRTIHEVIEADRANAIRLISAKASVSHVSKATGKPERASLIEVATTREQFLELNLASVVPKDALAHLGALVSKNIIGLQALPAGKSVRLS